MGAKLQKGKSAAKAKAKTKVVAKNRKKTERSYGDSIKSASGRKRVINPKRHRGKPYKGTRKNRK